MSQAATERSGYDPADLTAVAAVRAMREGQLAAVEMVEACLRRIQQRESSVRAWTYLDAEFALEQARRADERRRQGAPLGPLHALPVGIKDIIDTRDMPTEDGTVLHSGRKPTQDAAVVSLLKQAGAIILGKTVTTELAVYAPGKTTNPHDPGRTPGGSSSGSAAAVASGMVPLALGTQTNGSVIRPAAFCGTVGYKPTFGCISRFGVLRVAQSLDTVGVFTRSVEDAALAGDALFGYDAFDSATRPAAKPGLFDTTCSEPPLPPRFAFVKGPAWDQAQPDTRDALAELGEELGVLVNEVELSPRFDGAIEWHRVIMEAEMALSFAPEYERGRDRLSDILVEMMERGRRDLAVDYIDALAQREGLRTALVDVFDEYDAILTPAAPGEAPAGLGSTGSPIFCTLWTYLGLPAISLPLLQGSHGMPMGVQLVGAAEDDARLLRSARWLTEHLAN
jgi:Asp-tRNA(Asn)/Glu-tRNA(Gln) amidotransferase A subunit family amidase